MIPLLRPSCTEAEIENVAAVLRSGWWGNGPQCAEFERQLAARAGYAHCITVNSCTAALHLALLASGIEPGDEVIVPALTFVSTALAVRYCRAKVVFADVLPDTLTLDWMDVLRKTTLRTMAVIPVDYAGYPAADYDIPGCALIEDAAHNVLGEHHGDMVCYSFHPVKNIGTGDGGAILTNDDEQAERLRALRWCGIDRSTWERTGKRYSWDYDIAEVGYKCHWNDVQAAIGLAQLARFDAMQERRIELVWRYFEGLRNLDGIELPATHPAHRWHLFVIRVDADRRDGLLDYLAERGIAAGVHYKPLYLYPPFANGCNLPVTQREWRRLVTLPLYADMTDDEQAQVITAVRRWHEAPWYESH